MRDSLRGRRTWLCRTVCVFDWKRCGVRRFNRFLRLWFTNKTAQEAEDLSSSIWYAQITIYSGLECNRKLLNFSSIRGGEWQSVCHETLLFFISFGMLYCLLCSPCMWRLKCETFRWVFNVYSMHAWGKTNIQTQTSIRSPEFHFDDCFRDARRITMKRINRSRLVLFLSRSGK